MSGVDMSRTYDEPSTGSLLTPETVFRTLLSDGTVLLCRSRSASNAVIVQGLVRAGEADVEPAKNGLARFMAECLTRGTEKRSMHQLYETAESLGASFNTYGAMHSIRFGLRCLTEDLPELVGLLAEVLQLPAFPLDEIERVRAEILTEIEERDQDTRSVADMMFSSLLYPEGHPYARTLEGTEETVNDITRDDLVGFYEEFMPSRPMIISVVGGVDPQQVADLFGRVWGGWTEYRTRQIPSVPFTPDNTSREYQHTVLREKYQIDISWGGIGLSRFDPDFVITNLANLVLGGFGLMGRLGQRVREEQGLAYYATSRLGAGIGRGPWVCLAGVAPEHYAQALDSIAAEVTRLREEEVPAGELDDCKAHLTGALPLKLESNEGTAAIMTEIELYQLGWDYLVRFSDIVQSITSGQVLEAARKYLDPGHIVITSAGPEV